jgi:hypothetical protein
MTSSASTVKLHTNTREREMYDNLADLYAIIKTTEALEKALLRDCIKQDEYKQTCAKLINQFKAAQNLTQIKTPSDIKKFMQDYRVCWRRRSTPASVFVVNNFFFFFFFFFFFHHSSIVKRRSNDSKKAFRVRLLLWMTVPKQLPKLFNSSSPQWSVFVATPPICLVLKYLLFSYQIGFFETRFACS